MFGSHEITKYLYRYPENNGEISKCFMQKQNISRFEFLKDCSNCSLENKLELYWGALLNS